jgi:hypothetical protein
MTQFMNMKTKLETELQQKQAAKKKKQRQENSYTPSYFPGTKSELDKPKTS